MTYVSSEIPLMQDVKLLHVILCTGDSTHVSKFFQPEIV